MNFSQLQSFVALAETGSFTEAAYTINLTQSAVSHALSALESELGVTLLERNRKGVVSLSHVGEKILPHVRLLLAQAEAIEQEAKVARGEAAGKVRLGSIESMIPPRLLASMLTRFRVAYPDIEVVLFEGPMHEVGDWIEQGVIDVGFVLLPAPGIDGTLLTTDELCVLLPPGHPLQTRKTLTPEELREEGFVMEKTQCSLNLMRRAGFVLDKYKSQIRYQASDTATILAMVREGLGITLMPRKLLPSKLEGVVALSLNPPQDLRIGLAVKSQDAAPPGAKLFIQTALTCVQAQAEAMA
ncbi:LysR family transcriptional regulator [Ktedonobacter robiniae]|uniref:LysR family transcriptional regulator n=1 Tax=Ktedonobacter robiniae TaxID=2778365 RepID=A0ABQ3V538_9CHLR|nr:LysR family transcriptional regulator [Ktedonobacter robiniae]GHO59882.1 LysR family transcriptional regulator [Ktedonobacter robiniae]